SELVVAKGSVALDGISLTVNNCGQGFLEVNIIPATAGETTVSGWKPGTRVNMETDIIGKYVNHMLKAWTGSGGKPRTRGSGLSLDFLQKHGFGT
ncbi:MAG: riboflavin synthase, partial [Thermodesulfobacteriota bacterium]